MTSHKSFTKLIVTDTYVAIDTETTGVDISQCEIIEIAATKVIDGRIAGTFQELVRPEGMPVNQFITDLTGITNEMLEGSRRIQDVLPEFLLFIDKLPIIGQNINFDIRFVNAASDMCGYEHLTSDACDIMHMSRLLYPEMAHHRLSDTFGRCCKEYGEEPDFGTAHRAFADVEMTRFCYEVMKPQLIESYGEDPETEFRRLHAKQKHTNMSRYLADLAPTVAEIDPSNPFFGSNVCFTGTLSKMTRKEAWQATVNLGGVPQKTVTKKTDYLVIGSFDFSSCMKGNKSSKLRRAEELQKQGGVPVILSEDFFMQFVEEAE